VTPGSTQGVPRSSSDPYLVPPQFKKPRTPPPRTVVATTRTEMYMRHTSQDVTVTSPTPGLRRRHVSSSSTSSGSRIPGPPQTSPRSSVQQWLDALDTQVPPPPTPVIPVSQPVSLHSGVTSSMPLGYSASQMAAQRVRSSRHSQSSRRARFSTTSATVIQGMMDFSSQMTNNIAHLSEGVRVDAAHREDAMRHESLAREQCHRIQAGERERAQREEALARDRVQRKEALEQDKLQKQEALERERMLKQEAMELRQEAIRVGQEASERDKAQKQEALECRREVALREERMRADMLATEELRVRFQAETDERNLAREKLHAEIKAKNKQFKLQANNELQQQKQDAEMKVQLAQMELMERRELEFQQEKLREKDITAKEMEACLLLERQLADEKRKTGIRGHVSQARTCRVSEIGLDS